MRNNLLNTARHTRIEERKGHKDAQNTPKGLKFEAAEQGSAK
jgi:hypothetical protein